MVFIKIWFFSFPFLLLAQHEVDMFFPYQLETPLQELAIHKDLEEISGLSMDVSGEHLIAIQDEKGNLYYLDKNTGEKIKEINFWKEGDYEGIELVGEDVFVVKSTGTLYHIKNVGQEDQSLIKYNGFLNSDNDIEGLTYWPQKNKLLLACKAYPGENMDATQEKAIYAFDLSTNSFDPKPLMIVERSIIGGYLQSCHKGPDHLKICELFDTSKEEFKLSPAAVAIHPITGHLYIISSKGNLLITLNLDGKILHIAKLPKKLHRQPEGLCFDKAGNMYISNERRKEHEANIVVYRFLKD